MSTLSIDIGGTKIRAGLVDGGAVTEMQSIETAPGPGEDEIMPAIIRLAQSYDGVTDVAVASAGVIVDGVVTSATDLIPNWAGTNIAAELGTALDVPVTVLGDVHAHGVGEATYGVAKGYPSSLTVAVGTGIGGAFVVDGKPMIGEHGVAGHVGHISHGAAANIECSCGRFGHIEAIASGSGMAAAYERATGEHRSGPEMDQEAIDRKSPALKVMHDGGFALGEVIGSLTNALDPGIIVVTGSVSRAVDPWWQALRCGFAAAIMDPVNKTPLVKGELGDEAPLIGAAAYAKVKNA